MKRQSLATIFLVSILVSQCDRQQSSAIQNSIAQLPKDQSNFLMWVQGGKLMKGFCANSETPSRETCRSNLIQSNTTEVRQATLADVDRLKSKTKKARDNELQSVVTNDDLVKSYRNEIEILTRLKTNYTQDLRSLIASQATYQAQIDLLTTQIKSLQTELDQVNQDLEQKPNDPKLVQKRAVLMQDIDNNTNQRDDFNAIAGEGALQINDLQGKLANLDVQLEDIKQKLDSRLTSGVFTSVKLKQIEQVLHNLNSTTSAEIEKLFEQLSTVNTIADLDNLNSRQKYSLQRLVYKDVPMQAALYRRTKTATFDCNHRIVPSWNNDHYEIEVEWLECKTDANRSKSIFICNADLICTAKLPDESQRTIRFISNINYQYANDTNGDSRFLEYEFFN